MFFFRRDGRDGFKKARVLLAKQRRHHASQVKVLRCHRYIRNHKEIIMKAYNLRNLQQNPLNRPLTLSIDSSTSGRFKSYRSGRSRIILRARSVSMTFFLSGNSSCIIFAVVRSTLLLLDFSLEYFVLSSLACVPTIF